MELECGFPFLILLKCIGMWNVEWKSAFQFHSRILECGMWNCSNSHSRILECGMWKCSNSHSRILEWNWNVDSHSTFHIPMHFSKVRNETFSKRTISHSTFQNSGMELECGIFHSTFHIPVHFSKVRNETFSKKAIPHSTFQNSGMGIGIWSIPHSAFQCTLARLEWDGLKGQFHIPHSKILEWELECGRGEDIWYKVLWIGKIAKHEGIGETNVLWNFSFTEIPVSELKWAN